jgi:hypothetical protein
MEALARLILEKHAKKLFVSFGVNCSIARHIGLAESKAF